MFGVTYVFVLEDFITSDKLYSVKIVHVVNNYHNWKL